MKRFLAGLAFLTVLFLNAGLKTVLADAVDRSDNFTKIYIEQSDQLLQNNQLLTITAEFNDGRHKFKSGDTMTISWQSRAKKADLEAIEQEKDLIIKEVKVGTYTVKSHQVLVKFNDNVEKLKDVSGKLDFYAQVHNLTPQKQELVLQAGKREAKLMLAPWPENKLLAEFNGRLNMTGDSIAWEIKLNPDQKEFVNSLILATELPEGMEFDAQLKVLADGKLVNLDQSDVQYKNNGVAIRFNSKNYSGKAITVYLQTNILDKKALKHSNQFLLTYQLANNQPARKDIYEGTITNDRQGIEEKENVEGTRKYRSERVIKALSNLIELIFGKREKEKDSKPQVKTVADTYTPTINTKTAEQVNPKGSKGLTGFDKNTHNAKNSTIKVAKTANSDPIEKDAPSETLAKANYHDSKDDTHRRVDHLPKTGETKLIILSVAGLGILFVGSILWKKSIK